jgi:hypothetical protein
MPAAPLLRVVVTQEHIDKGVPVGRPRGSAASSYCALELGLIDAGWGQPCVAVTLAWDEARHPQTCYLVPDSARRFMLDFDAGRPVCPRTFVLRRQP